MYINPIITKWVPYQREHSNFVHLSIYIGDFKSHSMAWEYEHNDENGEILYVWMTTNNLGFVFSAKDKETLRLDRWCNE